jgi:hypothetical protein
MTWNQRIAEALMIQKFTPADHRAVGSWATCKWGEMAVTRKLAGLKFGQGSFPADPLLLELGARFAMAVWADDTGYAATISERMEARAVELAEAAPRPAGAVAL